ncbi:hypothetical protein AAFM46_08265 [Arthrobacter sp. TMP15]|uniref:hypothetical protein n=1 Tax=Arthrobacter sp. TMP15 TaxID=3140789 RepID=UPI0031BB7801
MPRNRGPLREQSFLIFSIVGGMLIGILAVLVLPALFGNGREVKPGLLLVVVVVTLVVAAFAVLLRQIIGKRLVGDRIEAALREHDGKWRHGRITVGYGQLSFQPYLWQVRIPSGTPVELEVSELGEDTGQRPPLRKIWSMNPQLHIVQVVTNRGLWELAGLPSQIEELRTRLSEPEATAHR